jgi:hypothetical protein
MTVPMYLIKPISRKETVGGANYSLDDKSPRKTDTDLLLLTWGTMFGVEMSVQWDGRAIL